ncbi:hypothetical protein [Falsiroseomonas sp.]|uniref:hypothetical protein n=1 Tax=Falsiroseomonas sp. TaxID=2870721 RepID=UPI0034A0E008
MPFPFEVPAAHLEANLEAHVDSIYAGLSSDFIAMPKGDGFVDYATFEEGYEALKKATGGFSILELNTLIGCILEVPIAFVVLRTMLGFTPPELAYTTTVRTKVEVDQGFARTLDRKVRLEPKKPLKASPLVMSRLQAMVWTANQLLREGVPEKTPATLVHRLGKIDTQHGKVSIKASSELGIPYAALLYEPFLGRPFAGHRDSVSELVGDAMESAIERQLSRWGVSNHKTKRAEKVPGFVQAPDFIIPSWANPKVIIEAKVTEDDGTARDKVTRIINLVNLAKQVGEPPKYQVVAALAGRGFAVRRQDMRNLLVATGGKVFTLPTVRHIVEHTDIKGFATRTPEPEPEPEPEVASDVMGVEYEFLTNAMKDAGAE